MSAQGSSSREQVATVERRAWRRALLRDGTVVLVLAVVLPLSWAVREIDNPDLPAAETLTARMDEVHDDVVTGTVTLDTTPAELVDGIVGARLERTLGDPRFMLTGTAGGDCYVLWWDPDDVQRTRVLAADLACVPSLTATSSRPDTFVRVGRAVRPSDDASPWATVLPDPTSMRVWVLLVLIAGGGVLLSALVRITIALLTGRAPSRTSR